MSTAHLTTDKLLPLAKCQCGRLYTPPDLIEQYRYPTNLTDRHTLITWSVVSILYCRFCGIAREHKMRVNCDASAQYIDIPMWNSQRYRML